MDSPDKLSIYVAKEAVVVVQLYTNGLPLPPALLVEMVKV